LRSNHASRRAEPKLPPGQTGFHEIKHDGYRLIVQREGKRVRLFASNGHDWTDRFSWQLLGYADSFVRCGVNRVILPVRR
jgi:ATP-dependent DNA ligase